jgi:hypothetical protein
MQIAEQCFMLLLPVIKVKGHLQLGTRVLTKGLIVLLKEDYEGSVAHYVDNPDFISVRKFINRILSINFSSLLPRITVLTP